MDQDSRCGGVGDPQSGHFPVFNFKIVRGVVQHEIRVGLDLNRVIRAVLQGKVGPAVFIGSDGIYQGIIHAADLKSGIGNSFGGLARVDLDNFNSAYGIVVKIQLLRVIGIDHHGLGLRIGVNRIARDAFHLRYHHCACEAGKNNLTFRVGPVQAIAGELPAVGIHKTSVRVCDFELYPFKRRFLVIAREFVDNELSCGLIAKFEGNRLPGLDLGRLGCVIQDETIFRPGFFDHECGARVDALNEDGPRGIGHEVAVAVAHHGPVALSHKELNIRNRGIVGTGHLFDKQRALGAVVKIDLNNLLIFAGEVHCLGRGVDHMRAVTGELFDNVSAGLAARDGERAVHRSSVSADDRAAGAGGVAGEIPDLEHSPLNSGPGLTVIFPYGNS